MKIDKEHVKIGAAILVLAVVAYFFFIRPKNKKSAESILQAEMDVVDNIYSGVTPQTWSDLSYDEFLYQRAVLKLIGRGVFNVSNLTVKSQSFIEARKKIIKGNPSWYAAVKNQVDISITAENYQAIMLAVQAGEASMSDTTKKYRTLEQALLMNSVYVEATNGHLELK